MNERFTGKNLLELPQDFSVVQIETTDLKIMKLSEEQRKLKRKILFGKS